MSYSRFFGVWWLLIAGGSLVKLCRGYSSCQHFPLRDFSRSNWPKIWTMLSGELNFSCLDGSSFVNAGCGVGLVIGKVLQMKLWHQLNEFELHISRLHGCWHFPWQFLMSSGEALGRMFSILPFHGYHAKIAEMPMGFVGSFPTQHNRLPSAFNAKEGCRDGSSTGVARKHGSSTRAARVAWWVRCWNSHGLKPPTDVICYRNSWEKWGKTNQVFFGGGGFCWWN